MPVLIKKPKSAEKELYSFSRLSAWQTCPYGYWLTYIEGRKGINNAYAQFGSLMHSLLERYEKGEVELWDLPEIYQWEFDSAITEEFPYGHRESFYNKGLEFLMNFSGINYAKIVGVEQEFYIDMGDWIFDGFIDLIEKDEEGNYIITDYKSNGSFKSKKEQKEYARQLYLYSTYIKEKYGVYPKELRFVLIRGGGEVIIPFVEKDYEEAIKWAEDTITEIRTSFDFPPKCDYFYSHNICNHRNTCEILND